MTHPYSCPICKAPWRGDSPVCASCGADLFDPDVQAMAQNPADSLKMPATETGTLTVGRVLGVSREGLADGKALRTLGLVGGLLLLAIFFFPAHRTYDFYREAGEWKSRAHYDFSWELLDAGFTFALFFPLVAGLLGLAVAIVPRLSADVRGRLLAGAGLIGLAACLGPLGEFGEAPTQLLHLTTLGLVVAGTAITGRMLAPHSMAARWGMVAGGVLVLAGFLIPASDATGRVPFEFGFWQGYLDIDFENAMPLLVNLGGLKPKANVVLFVAAFHLLPLLVLPAAAALAWKKPAGVWDTSGHALRPLAWFVVLYLPLTYALYVFTAMGWGSGTYETYQLSKQLEERWESALFGRVRLAVIATALTLWAQFGLLAALLARSPAPPAEIEVVPPREQAA